MRHPKNTNEEPGLTSPKTFVESIRSKYILSKTIDGLEKSAIVKTNLYCVYDGNARIFCIPEQAH